MALSIHVFQFTQHVVGTVLNNGYRFVISIGVLSYACTFVHAWFRIVSGDGGQHRSVSFPALGESTRFLTETEIGSSPILRAKQLNIVDNVR